MNLSTKLSRPSCDEYGDEILYGQRLEAARQMSREEEDKNSDCIMYTNGTAYVQEEFWNIRKLIRNDCRLANMVKTLMMEYTLPIQRYSWPQIELARFPLLAVSPEGSGKTMTHLLYAVAKCISATSINKTNEILSISDTLGTIKTSNSKFIHKPTIDLSKIDQDDIDFNAIDLSTLSIKTPLNGTSNHEETQKEHEVEMMSNLDEFIFHPKFIIISSSQRQVEFMEREIDRLKLAAFDNERVASIRYKELPPKVETMNVHQDDDKLTVKCNRADILISTPVPIIKCIRNGNLEFAKCEKIFFDDLDLTLQLHNYSVRELMKLYSSFESDQSLDDISSKKCQIYFFSRKWTNLVKHFLNVVFPQRIIMFGSIAEAALYANMRYDVELCTTYHKLTKLIDLLKSSKDDESRSKKIAVICNNDDDARIITSAINSSGLNGFKTIYLSEKNPRDELFNPRNRINGFNNTRKPIYVIGDTGDALDLISKNLTDITWIIHHSMPANMLTFDQRFRLMYAYIKDKRGSLYTTIFIEPSFNPKNAKELYDMMSRSDTTQMSSKLALRDLIKKTPNPICWRWASSGVCRLEKLSRKDGSYCPYQHSINSDSVQTSKWPEGGQSKITITHVASPSEFYFWFEAHRDRNSIEGKWRRLEKTGSEYMKDLQKKLDQFKNFKEYSVSTDRLKRGKIYGIYLQHEMRVDRVRLLEEPEINRALAKLTRYGYQASKQCEVFKVDYGVRIHIYLRNLFELPDNLADIEPQCHRGFHLGVMPTDNEPDWIIKAKKKFHELISPDNLHEVSAWLRLNSNNCFWFENMKITCRLDNIETGEKFYKCEPHRELIKSGLAVQSNTEPACLNPSERLLTLSKWSTEALNKYAQYAFMRTDKSILDIFVLHVMSSLELKVRLYEYNKQLIELESILKDDHDAGKLISLNFFEVGVYCLVKIQEGIDQQTNQPLYTINRAKILDIIESDKLGLQSKIIVECLDHGDEWEVDKPDLYQAEKCHISRLPFQAIKGVELANLNPRIFDDPNTANQIRNEIYNFTRTETDQLHRCSCIITKDKKIQLYVFMPSTESGKFDERPISDLIPNLT